MIGPLLTLVKMRHGRIALAAHLLLVSCGSPGASSPRESSGPTEESSKSGHVRIVTASSPERVDSAENQSNETSTSGLPRTPMQGDSRSDSSPDTQRPAAPLEGQKQPPILAPEVSPAPPSEMGGNLPSPPPMTSEGPPQKPSPEARPVTAAMKDVAKVFQSKSGASLPYRLLVPSDYDASKAYPLLIFLHGAGERGNDNKLQMTGSFFSSVGSPTKAAQQSRFPSLILVPQCARDDHWWEGDLKDQGTAQGTFQMAAQPSTSSGALLELLEALRGEYSIDERRLYLMGFSMGGFGTWDLISRFPRMFAAAIPTAGGSDATKAPLLAQLPIWAFHSSNDRSNNVIFTQRMLAEIRKAGGNPRYTDPKSGHNATGPALDDPGLLPWIFAQRRP